MRAKPLSSTEFGQLIERTPEQAASALLAHANGVDADVERTVWATWETIVGGEPGNRRKELSESAEAQFCIRVIGAVSEGAEDPPVAENGARRRSIQAWRRRASTARRIEPAAV